MHNSPKGYTAQDIKVIYIKVTFKDGSNSTMKSEHISEKFDILVRSMGAVKFEVVNWLDFIPARIIITIGDIRQVDIGRPQFIEMVKTFKQNPDDGVYWVKWSLDVEHATAVGIVDTILFNR